MKFHRCFKSFEKSKCDMTSWKNSDRMEKATEQQLDALEQQYRISLPQSYREFLMHQGGGEPSPNDIDFVGRKDQVGFVTGYKGPKPSLTLLATADFWGEPYKTGFVMIAANQSGDSWLMKVADPDHGAIFLWDHYEEDIDPVTFKHLTRAFDCFDDFLAAIG
jgi:hypothetical protein